MTKFVGGCWIKCETDKETWVYELASGKERWFAEHFVSSPCKNARLACFMSDGSIAAVGNNASKVEFKNIRTGEYSEVNSRKLYDGCKSGRYCSCLL